MDPFEQQEFWNALGRVYDTTESLTESYQAFVEVCEGQERRLLEAEVLIQGLLEDVRRLKNKGGRLAETS